MKPSRELWTVIHWILLVVVITCSVLTHTQVTVRLLMSTDHNQEALLLLFLEAKPPISNKSHSILFDEPHVDTIYTYSNYNDTTKAMDGLAEDLFQGTICQHIRTWSPTTTSISNASSSRIDRLSVVRVRFHCRTLFETSGLGTGNFISAIYALRIAAKAMGNITHIEFLCSDAHEEATNLILPWLTGVFPLPRGQSDAESSLYHSPPLEQACRPYQNIPIGYALDDIKWEMRRMAVALVGIPYPGHPSEAWAQEHLWSLPSNRSAALYQLPNPQPESRPRIPNVELDDAVLHFRCGDLIFSNLSRFGFMKFSSYSRHLDPNVTSIGIATQPFEAGRNVRSTDIDMKKKPQRCRQVIHAFVEHLHEMFPDARITIRNDPNESVALTYARMVMARQVVIGISTFGVFPAVSAFGRSYIRDPDYRRAPNQWLLEPWFREQAEAGGMTLIQEPRLSGFDCRKLWGNDGSAVLNWLRS